MASTEVKPKPKAVELPEVGDRATWKECPPVLSYLFQWMPARVMKVQEIDGILCCRLYLIDRWIPVSEVKIASKATPKDDLSDVIDPLKFQFKRLGYNWSHPRVQAWLQQCGFRNHYEAPVEAYEVLAKKLEQIPSSEEVKP